MHENSPQSIHFTKIFLGGGGGACPQTPLARAAYVAATWAFSTNLETPFLKSWIRHWAHIGRSLSGNYPCTYNHMQFTHTNMLTHTYTYSLSFTNTHTCAHTNTHKYQFLIYVHTNTDVHAHVVYNVHVHVHVV